MTDKQDDLIHAWITNETGFIARRTPPRRLDTPEKQHAELDAIKRQMRIVIPKWLEGADVERALDSLTTALDAETETASWPTPGEINRTLSKIVGRFKPPAAAPMPENRGGPSEADESVARQINASRPVSDKLIWGVTASRIVASGLTTQSNIDAYRRASVIAYRRAYGDNALAKMTAAFGEVVQPYFERRDAA
ncbi:MAG: hypothetical protein ACPH5G_17730 [Pseudooceanicola atlanticus]